MSKGAQRYRSPWDRPRQTRYTGTDIEIKMAQILATLGEEGKDWERQFQGKDIPDCRSHKFDFAFPVKRVLIEADGCRFHGCKKCCPRSKPRARDQFINEAAKAAGYTILRFWGHEIKGQKAAVRRAIEVALQQPT